MICEGLVPASHIATQKASVGIDACMLLLLQFMFVNVLALSSLLFLQLLLLFVFITLWAIKGNVSWYMVTVSLILF